MKGMKYFMSCEMYLTFLHISGASHEIKYNNVSQDISRKCLDFTEFCIPSLASRLSEFSKRIWLGILVCQLRLLPHYVSSCTLDASCHSRQSLLLQLSNRLKYILYLKPETLSWLLQLASFYKSFIEASLHNTQQQGYLAKNFIEKMQIW